jgi:hypothetical protein
MADFWMKFRDLNGVPKYDRQTAVFAWRVSLRSYEMDFEEEEEHGSDSCRLEASATLLQGSSLLIMVL